MAKYCDACAGLERKTGSSARAMRVRNLLVGDRLVCLCDVHAQAVSCANIQNIDDLRAMLRETDGRRSLVPRRRWVDRRVFPPRPEGRRQAGGRRSIDGEG